MIGIKKIKGVKIGLLSFKCLPCANGISSGASGTELSWGQGREARGGWGGGSTEMKDHILRAKKLHDI